MEHAPEAGAALTITMALAAGILCQSLARHLRMPGIVLLLLAGVLLGPDVSGVIDPETVRGALGPLIGIAVAVILFEGGLNLNIERLRREARVIQLLCSLGAVVTAVGGTLAARLILDWGWNESILFGALVIVTGPTVVTPLLRRLRVKHNLETILEAEGVLIDPIGAIIALVTLQVVLQPTSASLMSGLLGLTSRLMLGVLFGLVGGFLLGLLLRSHWLVPEGLENVFVLSFILLYYQASESILPESGIGTVTIAGIVVGNIRTRVSKEILEFKEQLTVMLIGMLFVLLAADVRLADVQSLGMPGVLTVVALMFVVRPVNVALSTRRSGLSFKEKLFLSWLAPRGIVAAAVASLFAETLQHAGATGSAELRAMVFLVIAMTVVVAGLTGGWVAQLLGVRRPRNVGYAILGANALGRALGRALCENREDIVFLDSNAAATMAAKEDGFSVIFGNALEEGRLERAQLESRAGCISVTTNDAANMLFARHAQDEFKVSNIWVGVQRGNESVNSKMILAAGHRLLFRRDRDLGLWDIRLRRGLCDVELWRFDDRSSEQTNPALSIPGGRKAGLFPETLLPVAYVRNRKTAPADNLYEPEREDQVHLVIFNESQAQAREWLTTNGWTRV